MIKIVIVIMIVIVWEINKGNGRCKCMVEVYEEERSLRRVKYEINVIGMVHRDSIVIASPIRIPLKLICLVHKNTTYLHFLSCISQHIENK